MAEREPPVPPPVSGDRVEPPVEVEIADQQPLDPGIAVVPLNGGGELLGAALVQHLIGLDVCPPWVVALPHGPQRLMAEHRVAPAHVPLGLHDPNLGIADGAHQRQGLVLGASHVDDDLVADRQQRSDAGFHREVQLDRVPDDGESRHLDHAAAPARNDSG